MDAETLERAIREAPDSPDAYLVYGDWLEGRGDPRGELIAVQAKLATGPTDALFAREWELLTTHERTWLGDVLFEERRADSLVCEWRFGFLRSVTMFAPSQKLFAALRDCPSARFLERLVVDHGPAPDLGPMCKVEIAEPSYLPHLPPAVRAEAEAAMAAVLAEADDAKAWDRTGDRQRNPHKPYEVARERLARLEYLPYLVEQLLAFGAPSQFASGAFIHLGSAAVAAATWLREHERWYELFCVAPDRAKSLGVHRRPPVRASICWLFRDKRKLVRHIAELLESDDVEVLRWALGSDRSSESSSLRDLTHERPRCLPVSRIRALLAHDDAQVRNGAAARLIDMRFPEDADRVINAILERRAKPDNDYTLWLGSHPKSDGLLKLATGSFDQTIERRSHERFQVNLRRRCAGLSSEDFVPAVNFSSRYPEKMFTLEHADALFVAGMLDEPILVYAHSALVAYARVLRKEPTCAPAAFRIAWIERGFGALITEERIAWLRGLGASDAGLTMLATPPPEPVPGYGYGESGALSPNPIRALAALAAGLPSLAAGYFPNGSAEAAAAHEAGRLQLATLC